MLPFRLVARELRIVSAFSAGAPSSLVEEAHIGAGNQVAVTIDCHLDRGVSHLFFDVDNSTLLELAPGINPDLFVRAEESSCARPRKPNCGGDAEN